MKTSFSAPRVLISILVFWGLEASSFVSAQVFNTYSAPPPPGYPAAGAARAPVSTRAARQSAATVQAPVTYPKPPSSYPPPAGYTYPPPPGYGMPPAPKAPTKPTPSKKVTSASSSKKAVPKTAPSKSGAPSIIPKVYGPTGDISTQVSKLVQSDRVQNSRIGDLERDVGSIKRGGKGSSGVRYDGGTDLASHTTHVVRPGETIWAIASSHRVSVGEIQQLNRLTDDSVNVGQTLLLPSPYRSVSTTPVSYQPPKVGSGSFSRGKSSSTTYTVKKGDSLKAIAIRHKLSTTALASANHIKDANKVFVGQRLVIPGRSASSTPRHSTQNIAQASSDTIPLPGFGMPLAPPPAAIAPQAPAPTAPSQSVPSADIHRGILAYRVDRSDTIESIAGQFTTTPDRIREMNHLQPGAKLSSGDEIMVPAMGAVSVSR